MHRWRCARLLAGRHLAVCGSTPPSSAKLCRSSGVDARLSSGTFRGGTSLHEPRPNWWVRHLSGVPRRSAWGIRVPYGALCRGGCWSPIRTFIPGCAGSIPVHGATPRWSIGMTPGSQPGDGGFDSRTRCVCSRGETGRRAVLKSRCLRACGFDSHREHSTGCRPAARPPALGAGERGFESLHPDVPVDQRSGHLADIEEMPVQLWPGVRD